jgi:hypothetical protein
MINLRQTIIVQWAISKLSKLGIFNSYKDVNNFDDYKTRKTNKPVSLCPVLFFKTNQDSGFFEVERVSHTKRNRVVYYVRHVKSKRLFTIQKEWFELIFTEAKIEKTPIEFMNQLNAFKK